MVLLRTVERWRWCRRRRFPAASSPGSTTSSTFCSSSSLRASVAEPTSLAPRTATFGDVQRGRLVIGWWLFLLLLRRRRHLVVWFCGAQGSQRHNPGPGQWIGSRRTRRRDRRNGRWRKIQHVGGSLLAAGHHHHHHHSQPVVQQFRRRIVIHRRCRRWHRRGGWGNREGIPGETTSRERRRG